MAENLNTLYYALGLDDHEMQQGLKKAIDNLSVLDEEFNRINKTIEETFGKKMKDTPVHKEIKGLTARLRELENEWKNLEAVERRGTRGQQIRADYEALRKEAGNLNNSLARLYSESQKAASGQKGLAAQFGLVNKELTLQSRLMSNVNTLFTTYVSIFAVKSFIQNLSRVRGEFENQQIALRAILRDAEAADRIFGQIKSFAVVSPFEFKDLVGYAKQLSAFQVPVNELFETTKRLADVSAGLGVGMDRIILAYGQVRSAAVLRGQELRQFTEAGIPLVDELAKKFSELEGRVVSAGDVFEKISNRMVSFEMVKEIFEDMTNEGGMFYMMQEKQAESLKGKIANLADAYDIMLNDIGQANDGILKGGVEGLSKLMTNWRGVADALKVVVVTYGTYRAAVIALNISDQIAKYSSLTKAIKSTTAAQKLLNSTLLTNLWVLAATVFAAVGMAMYNTYQEAHRLKNELGSIANEQLDKIDNSIDKFEELSSALYNSVEGSQQYRDIISQINRQYGEYLPNLLNEANALTELKKNYDLVTDAIYNKAKAQAYEKGAAKIEEEFGEIQQEYTTQLIQNLTGSGVSEKAAKNLVALYRAELEKQVGEYNPIEIFNNVYQSYFQTAEKYFTNIGVLAEQFREGTPFLRSESWGWESAYSSLVKYNDVFDKVKASAKEYNDYVDTMFSRTGYNTEDEAKKIEEISKKYEQLRDEAYKSTSSQDEYNEALDRLNIEKLKETLAYYKGIAETTPKLARPDIIKKLENQLDLLTKIGEAWREIVKNTIGKNKAGAIFNVQTNDDIFSYIEKLRNEYSKLTTQQEEINNGLVVSDETKNTIDARIKILEALSKALNFSLEKDKKGGSTKDPNTERLKEQIDLIKKAQAQYEKYLKIMSPDKAVRSIRRDPQFMALEIKFEPNKVKERLKKVMDDIGKLPKSPELEKLNRAIQLAFTDIDYDDAKKNFDKFLKDIIDRIDRYKERFNIYEALLAKTGNKELAAELSFGVDFEGEPDLEAYLEKEIKEIASKKFDLELDFSIKNDQSIKDQLKSQYETLPEELTKLIENLDRIRQDDADNEAKLYAESLARLGNYNQKKLIIEEKYAKLIAAARARGDKELEKSLQSEKNLEIFKISDEYTKFFTEIGNLSLDSAIKTRNALAEILKEALKTGALTYEEYMKNIKAADDQLQKRTDTNPWGAITGIGNKEGNTSGKMITSYMSNGVKGVNDQLSMMGDQGQNIAGKFNIVLAIIKAIDKAVKQTFAAMLEVTSAAAEMQSALGKEDSAERWKLANDYIQVFSDNYNKQIESIKNGDLIGSTANNIASVMKIVTIGAQRHDAKLEKVIKRSQEYVRTLEYAYSELQRAIDRSLGAGHNVDLGYGDVAKRLSEVNSQLDEMRAKSDQSFIYKIRYISNIKELEKEQKKLQILNEGGAYALQRQNLIDQQEELRKQMDAEWAKKKSDEGKIAEYQNQI